MPFRGQVNYGESATSLLETDMTRSICATATLLALAMACQTAYAKTPPTTRPASKVVKIGKVRVDLKKREVSFDSAVCLEEGALEFLLVQWQSKTHESILHTEAKASHIHAGLLMLGLTAGKPARWSGRQIGGRFLPPAGAGVKVKMVWEDADGKVRSCAAGEWLSGQEGQKIQRPDHWVFVGSDILPGGRYWAELDGEIISLTNFASAVLDVPFRSTSVNDLRGIFANTNVVPATGTQVEVVITPVPGAEKALDARETVEVDRFGRRSVNGKVLTEDQLEQWASKYIMAHDRGMVVIRANGMARVWDVASTESTLRLGGVREFEVQRIRPARELLPRAADQARVAMAEWKDKFANYRELLEDPGRGAERTLKQIEAQLKVIEMQKELLKDYSQQLNKAVARYKATTQPVSATNGLGKGGN